MVNFENRSAQIDAGSLFAVYGLDARGNRASLVDLTKAHTYRAVNDYP
jgi:hypothetical protein